jgi:hypothetical protein
VSELVAAAIVFLAAEPVLEEKIVAPTEPPLPE